jgi:ribosome-associated protein
MFVVNSRIQIPDDELQFTYARSSGPGGQNVNKVNSKAILHWCVSRSSALNEEVRARFFAQQRRRITTEGAIVISSDRYRDQPRNTADCLDKLKAMLLAAAVRPIPRRATKPTLGSKQRRLKSKTENSAKKQGRQKPQWD